MSTKHVSGKTIRRQEKRARREEREASTWGDLNAHSNDINEMFNAIDEQIDIFKKVQADGTIRSDDAHFNDCLQDLSSAVENFRVKERKLQTRFAGLTGPVKPEELQMFLDILGDYIDMFQDYRDRLMPVSKHLVDYVEQAEHVERIEKVRLAREIEKLKGEANE